MDRWLPTYQSGLEPEELFLIAFYRQVAEDLCCDSAKWRIDAWQFLEDDGFSLQEIAKIKRAQEEMKQRRRRGSLCTIP